MSRPSLRQRLEYRAARLLLSMPAGLQTRLSGQPTIMVEDHALHPQMQLLIAMSRWLREPPAPERDPHAARRALRADAASIAGPPIAVGKVADLAIPAPHGTIAARHYAPAVGTPRPMLVYLHGGGFVIGDLDSHDGVCRRLCRDGGLHVLSVDYRLAPEHRFPAATEDAFTAFRFACAQAAAMGARPDRIAVGGDSAGGNLAAVVAQKAAADGGPAPVLQLLLYPTLDRTTERRSMALFSEGYFLSRADIAWYHLQYTGTTAAAPDPAQNPLCATDLTGLAPALIVTAGFDPLRDEGEAYADALRQADVPVALKRFNGLLHGFCSMATISPACDAALAEIIAELRRMLPE